MRTLALFAAASLTVPAAAQSIPSNFREVELNRSRACVDVLGRLDALDERLAPLAERSQRLRGISEAIAIEESAVVGVLSEADSVEAAVKAWFAADSALARRYLAGQDPSVLSERTARREAIKGTVEQALAGVQARADTIIRTTGTLQAEAGRCNGAVFVRSAILEACGAGAGTVCDAARDTTAQPGQYRFVDSAELLWDMQQLRPWTPPGPLTVSPTGQLAGARTVAYTRTGNIVVNLVFYPALRQRGDVTPEQLAAIQMVNDSLGFDASHPTIVSVPTLGVQVALPEPLGDESIYIIHFGEPDNADIVWTGEAGTGVPLEAVVELGPSEVTRLAAGDPLTLTAIRESEGGTNESVFAIDLTAINQARSVQALTGYMRQQLTGDLRRFIPPAND